MIYFIIDFAVLLKQNYLVKIYLFINLVIGWFNTTILWTLITVTQNLILESQYCIKSVRIWNYFDPYFPSFGRKYLHSVSLRIQSECGKITDQNNSEYGHFSRSAIFLKSNGKRGWSQNLARPTTYGKRYFKFVGEMSIFDESFSFFMMVCKVCEKKQL